MRLSFIIFLIILSGCASPKIQIKEKIKYLEKYIDKSVESDEMIEEIKESQKLRLLWEEKKVIGEAKLFLSYPPEKRAFIQAFQKVGFDPFEVTKLMTPRDDRELCVRKFMIKNRRKLYLTGDWQEIMSGKYPLDYMDKLFYSVIKNVELNYKLFLQLQGE